MSGNNQEPLPRELSERKRQILKAVVEAHITNGEPVGSRYLLEHGELSCSSATIRNEMAELETLGYLEQPHASSGRVPSERGYRFYVDTLVEHYAMTAREIYQINELLQVKMAELDHILLTASKVASNLTNYTAFAIKPRAMHIAIKRFDAVFMDAETFILVLVTMGGRVKTKTVRLSDMPPLSQSVTDLLASVCNEHLHDLSANEITLPMMIQMEQAMGENAALVSVVVKVIYEAMSELDEGEVKVSGMDRLLEYPEFSDPERMRQVLNVIEGKEDILRLVSDIERDGVSVVIGSEDSSIQIMDHSALVYKPIVKDGKTVGAIGVLGPARMDYARVLATIEEITGSVEAVLGDGGERGGMRRLPDGNTDTPAGQGTGPGTDAGDGEA